MKHWYDAEFIEDGKTIDLVSIGIVAEDGREFYAVSSEFNVNKLLKRTWLKDNVWPTLPQETHEYHSECDTCQTGIVHLAPHKDVWTRVEIAFGVRQFLTGDLSHDAEADLWGWFPSYDHVVLCQLWGTMMDKPHGIPARTNCVQQEAQRLDIEGLLPEPPPGQHNALVDARYHRTLWEFTDGFARDHARA